MESWREEEMTVMKVVENVKLAPYNLIYFVKCCQSQNKGVVCKEQGRVDLVRGARENLYLVTCEGVHQDSLETWLEKPFPRGTC